MEAAVAAPTAAETLLAGERRLRAAGIESARLDAELLLAWAWEIDRTALYARLREPLPSRPLDRFHAAAARRCRREPLAYLTGIQEFWSLPFAVTPDVLIPRPETELLVEIVLRAPDARRAPLRVCDLGTGSGCLAVAIARELPGARVVAVDVSDAALAVARANATTHGVGDRICFAAGDLFAALAPAERFDVIVSNPPYLAAGDATSPEVAFEPARALAAGADGLAVIRRLIAGAPQRLRPGGRLVMEIGCGQADAVRALAAAAGIAAVAIEPDLAGLPRALVAGWA